MAVIGALKGLTFGARALVGLVLLLPVVSAEYQHFVADAPQDSPEFVFYDEPPAGGDAIDFSQVRCPLSVNAEDKSSGHIFLAGLVKDASEMKPETITWLLDLNCIHHVEIHILSGGGKSVDDALELIAEAKLRCFGDYDSCATFTIDPDPPGTLSSFPNRVDRIAYLRDHQREIVRSKIISEEAQFPDAVVVADLELHRLPASSLIRGEIERLVLEGDDHDIICSAGLMHHPFGYYDTFATILMSNTFVYPRKGRLVQDPTHVEDDTMIRSDEMYGELTQEGIYKYLLKRGQNSPSGTVQVRSCFGGMAIYRASAWFHETCRYSMTYPPELTRYANVEDGRPCEHVVFHECILSANSSTKISVMPSMNTFWDEPVVHMNYLFSGGKIFRGLHDQDGLVTSQHHPEYGLRLENGNFVLRIDEQGSLFVEEHTSMGPTIIKWKITSNSTLFREKWEYMFLTLAEDGELVLSQQVKDSDVCPQEHCFQVNDTSTCRPCRYAVWSSDSHGDAFMDDYVLHLGHDGILRVVDIKTNRTLWQNEGSFSAVYERALYDIKNLTKSNSIVDCIPSGNQDSINQALSGRFAEAILCPGAIFELKSPIKFTGSRQSVYTQGKPTGHGKAVLRIASASLATAVDMLNRDHAELSHVIIDGNRPKLGKVDVEWYGEPLIRAGGDSRGQIIQHIDAYEPRSWTALHVAEGDPFHRCGGALVEYNKLGPAGEHTEGAWSDGLSMACLRSIVKGNNITDATDVGLVLFGAPGSVVEDNLIIARTRSANGGITLVDYAPYGGNFSGSIVQRNIIDAENATIGIGVAMGPRIWQCMADDVLMDQLVWGATVVDNVLKGDHMQYGFAVDGVRNWTVMGNIDEARHVGESVETCQGMMASAPAGFQIDWSSSTGVFQDEFEEARLCNVVSSVAFESSLTFADYEKSSLRSERIYQRMKHPFPCYPENENSSGFFFVRVPKTGSTTVAGVARRIVAKKGDELDLKCNYRGGHALARTKFKGRDPTRSFLWSFIREPAERALSSFFYHSVAKQGIEASDKNFLEWADSFDGNFQLDHLRLEDYEELNRESIEGVLNSYDFIGITERMDESLVVLAMLLGIDVGDILYMDAKRSGYAFTSDSEGNFKCVKLLPKEYSRAMREHFLSEDWRNRNQGDIAFYKSANQSLDRTIESLGRKRFENNLDAFRTTLRYSQDRCKATTRFPCSSDGLLQPEISNCYARDEGCGYPCLDSVSKELLQDSVGIYDRDIPRSSCISSGDQNSINEALSGLFAEAILCPGSTFELKSPISLGSHQSVYTQGKPTGHNRAVLRIANASLVTAINMVNRDYAELSHVIVDGNRPELGKADVEAYGEALIRAGGETEGQIIRHIDAYEPRGWTALHVAEGDPSRRCIGALVEFNKFGPAGEHIEGAWSSGLSMACTRSIVKGNNITDVTDVGLVLFGAPGSVVEDNLIIARTRSANGGITLVDYAPYGGNFSGSIVQRNLVDAENATIGIGVAMGPRIWQCMADEVLKDQLVWGATVVDNVLKGDHMQYGFAVDGVRNWTVLGNIDEARHVGESVETCQGIVASAPAGFQIDWNSSTGVFQDEFSGAILSNAVENGSSSGRLDSVLELVWLMSFPNSGTSYTLGAIANISSISTATNYAIETSGDFVSFPQKRELGPFWLRSDLDRPTKGLILTKTHCGGYNLGGRRNRLLISKPRFLQDCLTARDDASNRNFYYGVHLVKRGVHLIRDPFDNIVSRFHHERTNSMTEDEKLIYEDSPSGFRAFCRDKIDHPYWRKGFDSPVDDDLWSIIESVPCHTDFLRYVNWHNLAFEVTIDAKLPSLVVHYEQYTTHWNETVTALLDFLEQPTIGNPSKPFRSGKVYRHYYEAEEVDVVRSVFKASATKQTWSNIWHYFENATSVENASGPNSITPLYSKDSVHADEKVESLEGQSDFPALPCSYDALRNAFAKSKDSVGEATPPCWHVEEETLMIPLESIVDIDNLELLGIGTQGIVHKALVRLDEAGSICSVAVKTVLCRNALTNRRDISCTLSDAKKTHPGTQEKLQFFAESEYLGALLFVASQKAGLELPGLLPTWGLLHKEIRAPSGDSAHIKSFNISSYVVGAVMPVVDINDLEKSEKDPMMISPYDVAKMMMPAAEVLLFAEMIGLSYQDVHRKNMGISPGSEHAFLFDNTYLSLVDDGVCSSHEYLRDACTFCLRDYFPRKYRYPHYTDRMVRKKDCKDLVLAIFSMLPPRSRSDFPESSALFKDLDSLAYFGDECHLKDVVKALRNSVVHDEACIPSGDQDSINRVLLRRSAKAVLCPGAIFELRAPIVFMDNYQSVYTQGKPTGRDRAVLRIANTSFATAINMLNRDYAELSHVIVDGSRPELGKADVEVYGEALIRAGGEAEGQIIRHIDAYEPRGWTALHVAEGDPSRRCSGILVEDNQFGPAGEHIEGAWSSGLSMACTRSIVKGNTITDATDVGLVLFGAPGSVVEDNLIIARTRSANGGITLVDYAPYGGNFSGTVVQRIPIDAENATIGIGVAMGPRIWQCMADVVLNDQLVWGATVVDNVLKGDHMQYGFAVDGVRNWTVLGNIDEARHVGESVETCQGIVASAPAGFQIDWSSSTGVFQDEFEEARLCHAASASHLVPHSRRHVALLVSFPNSGTSYTLRVTRRTSLISFATNYGTETLGNLASIYGENVPGPFWKCCSGSTQVGLMCDAVSTDQAILHFECPEEGYILTKTHCGGDLPESYLLSKQHFLQECLTTRNKNGDKYNEYSLSLVKSIVHLIRDPFDNIVSRFHHERANAMSADEKLMYEDSPSGFRAFCRDKVDQQAFRESVPVDNELWSTIQNVSCHMDFLRYVNWHNLAFEVTTYAKLPSMVVYYEQYGTHWNETVSALLDFLEQPIIWDPSQPFKSGKVYRHYYEAEEVDRVRSVFKQLASKQTWSDIRHYFGNDQLIQRTSDSSILPSPKSPKVCREDIKSLACLDASSILPTSPSSGNQSQQLTSESVIDFLLAQPSPDSSTMPSPQQKDSGLLTRLPFIFGPATIDMLPQHGLHHEFSLLTLENLDYLSNWAYEEDEEDETETIDDFYLNADVVLNADGSLVSFAGIPSDVSENANDIYWLSNSNFSIPGLGEDRIRKSMSESLSCPNPDGMLHVRFASMLNQSWTDRLIALPPDIGSFTSPGAYIEKNGTVTMVLDTCSAVGDDSWNTSCFTIIEAKHGCTMEGCDSWTVVGTPNFLPIPRNCSLDPDDPLFACPCHVDQPTIWYDKPLQKWRMLMHQYPSQLVDGRCVPQPHYYEYAGGYAETVGQSSAGPWIYDYFQPAYGNKRRFQEEEVRQVSFRNHSRREMPKVVLGESGGLDGGYIVNAVCTEEVIHTAGEVAEVMDTNCGTAIQPVVRSFTTSQQRTSGTIYLTYHADTDNSTFPLGIGPKGLHRAKYMASIFDGSKFEAPQTIIAAQVRDPMKRGQRMQGTVTPLAQRLGINITKGPILAEDPYWTYHPASTYALQALKALANGTVLVSWWSYTIEFCQQLGASCDIFDDFGEMLIFEVRDGVVVSIERTSDGFPLNYRWDQLPTKVQTALEILGYNQLRWDNDDEPESLLRNWTDLRQAEQCAASELGYDEEKWNAHYEIPLDISSCGGVSDPYSDNETKIVHDNDLLDVERCLKMLDVEDCAQKSRFYNESIKGASGSILAGARKLFADLHSGFTNFLAGTDQNDEKK